MDPTPHSVKALQKEKPRIAGYQQNLPWIIILIVSLSKWQPVHSGTMAARVVQGTVT